MAFKKGKPKTGGREVGTPNKVNKALRERVKELVERRFDTLEENLNYLEPKEQIIVLMKLMEFVLPKATHAQEEAAALPLPDESMRPVLNIVFRPPAKDEAEICPTIN